ncbi:hypothetical protein H6P81_019688 [Aristolochia fimbriata]|uniref:Uncharacterized protein n=1 Tax=Aristolochia fimbriata TaxID=158543 RepID=A0AAV7DSI3_ARIFI|nr:hypothetical protein H6P81_019688 [Aristolochia fimbriata]
MTQLSKSTSPPFLFVFFVVCIITSASETHFLIRNHCPYNVWAAAIPGNGGRELQMNILWGIKMPINTTTVRIWGRTNCIVDSSSSGSKLSCQTGDCNGLFNCTTDHAGKPPFSLAKFTMEQFHRLFRVQRICPQEARVPGGCNNSCSLPHCTISKFFENMCPQANAYLDQAKRNEFRCPSGTSYSVTFCPPT